MTQSSQIIVNNGGKLILYSDSTLVVDEMCNIIVEKGSTVEIYGDINVTLSVVDNIINNDGIYIDSAAHVNVEDLNLGERVYSITDYEQDLRKEIINPYTQGEYNSFIGRVSYRWRYGSPLTKSQVIELAVTWGEMVLGDFKLSVLGRQKNIIEELQVVESFQVDQGCTLYISENYQGYRYLRPELYLGVVIDNCYHEGFCNVNGTIVVDGKNSLITIDRGSTLTIEESGTIRLVNKSSIRSTHNELNDEVLFIKGTLIIESLDQLIGFKPGNIIFGDKGKIIIFNNDNTEDRILFSTPVGIHESKLYELFKDNLNHIEYHIPEGNGIKIDKYFEYYHRDMIDWYAEMRIERAIHEGLIVWESGAFIELDSSIIPWVNPSCSLFHAARLFKSSASSDKERLQEVVNHLKYAGCGNILFRFIDGEEISEIELNLKGIKMISATSHGNNTYLLETDTDGELFLKNDISDTSIKNIVADDSKVVNIRENKALFKLK